MKSKKFNLRLVEAWQPEFWVAQALQEIVCWATYEEVDPEDELEALLELRDLVRKALRLGVSPYELLFGGD